MEKKIPLNWLIETLDARLNPYREEVLSGVVEAVVSDLRILGLIDEAKLDLAEAVVAKPEVSDG